MSRVLVIDPITMKGGSKVATLDALQSWSGMNTLQVLTSTPDAWPGAQIVNQTWIPRSEHPLGLAYYAQLIWHALLVSWALIWTRPSIVVGASTPHVDAGAMFAAKLFGKRYVQFVHGPAPDTKLTRIGLRWAQQVFALKTVELAQQPDALVRFNNGINAKKISPITPDAQGILWAASNMPWKRLDVMIQASQNLDSPITIACLPVNEDDKERLPMQLPKAQWAFDPPNLDALRRQRSIFVSTSEREPFGLSILEAMTAGLCPVIPADGAYWDQHLKDGEHCLNYTLGDPDSLEKTLQRALANPEHTHTIGNNAKTFSQQYSLENAFSPLHQALDQLMSEAA